MICYVKVCPFITVSKLESITETETIASTETEPDQTVDLETTPLETSTTSQSLSMDSIW